MLFVKKKENEINEIDVKFEVLSRSPFNNMDFFIDKFRFTELFRCVSNDMINTNLSNHKQDIYECVDEIFVEKMLWWNYNIVTITSLNTLIYGGGKPTIESYGELDQYKDEYLEKFSVDHFIYSKDYKFFKDFFNNTVVLEEASNG